MRYLYLSIALMIGSHGFTGAAFEISGIDLSGRVSWTGGFPVGICTVEVSMFANGPWLPRQNVFTTNAQGQVRVFPDRFTRFFRLLTVDISSNSPAAFGNLTLSYGILETIAGSGLGNTDGVNYWQASFEGGPATNAALSRPHFAMSDSAGNVFIVDKDSHSVLKVTPDGSIHTVAGTHAAGNGPDSAAVATSVALKYPNGLWVAPNDIVYILDTGNGKIRRLAPDGTLSTLATDKNGISVGRGLWVSADESLAYFCDGQDVKRWSPGGGFHTVNNKSFVDLGNLFVDPNGQLFVTDRGANRAYRVNQDGSRDPIAGNGLTGPVIDGAPALSTSFFGVRGIWFLPNNGYLLALHEGGAIAYVDPAGIAHTFVAGAPGATHGGDGQWFYSPGMKIAEARSVTLDGVGNVLIVENDAGFVRRVRFTRINP